MTQQPFRPPVRWPVILALLILIVFALIFIFAFVVESGQSNAPVDNEVLSAETYIDIVAPLLAQADAENGDRLINQYECHICHREAAERIAPSFVGLAERAATRRTPLTAAAYIYESIMRPGAYIVEGYADAMVQNYADRLSDRDLGDIIAYLLTADAK